MTQIADLEDRLRRLAWRREQEGIYTDAMLADGAADRIAALEAQLAARTGGVKPLGEDDYEEIISAAAINMRKATSGIRGQVITVQDSLDWWVMKETERRILSALEPAAPEGRQEAVALIRWAHDTLYEINPSNYDHDEVCKLNDASVEVILGLARFLGEKHGKTDEWWSEYNSTHPAPSTRPPEQAVTEAMVAAAAKALRPDLFTPLDADELRSDDFAWTRREDAKANALHKARAALKAAMEAKE